MTAVHDAYIKSLEDQILALKRLDQAKTEILEIVVKQATQRETEYKEEIARLRAWLEKKGVYFLDPNAEFEG